MGNMYKWRYKLYYNNYYKSSELSMVIFHCYTRLLFSHFNFYVCSFNYVYKVACLVSSHHDPVMFCTSVNWHMTKLLHLHVILLSGRLLYLCSFFLHLFCVSSLTWLSPWTSSTILFLSIPLYPYLLLRFCLIFWFCILSLLIIS
jgi:hypothetical protein